MNGKLYSLIWASGSTTLTLTLLSQYYEALRKYSLEKQMADFKQTGKMHANIQVFETVLEGENTQLRAELHKTALDI